ncbi:cell division protein ZapE [Amorphus coralli]|uniref:cell division protein ZapE n=1 Tax=Amorphus coralli TaxID=340680 RepID=UPI00037ED038|nr:cell division protein ZapE [Amorphus coralli]
MPTASVLDRYDAMVDSGSLDRDPAQEAVAQRLGELCDGLAERPEPGRSSGSVLKRLLGRRDSRAITVKGLYLWGEVGRGKTMLMDLFFEVAPVERKRRAHFTNFMADVHERVHRTRQAIANGDIKGDDPIPPVAASIAEETELLCFDEFSVTDIADAMILGRLFTRLFECGVVLVATSNVAPDDLYKGGLNRGHFLGFIDLLKRHVEVARLDAHADYRLDKLAGSPVYFDSADADETAAMERLWRRLLGGRDPKPERLDVLGHPVSVPLATGGLARFSFADLCERPLGASDYRAIADRYHTVFVTDVPPLSPQKRNETKRFITLVDVLYDTHVRLIVSAAAEPDALFTGEEGTEAFEFKRAASRLVEMRSASYVEACETMPLT